MRFTVNNEDPQPSSNVIPSTPTLISVANNEGIQLTDKKNFPRKRFKI